MTTKLQQVIERAQKTGDFKDHQELIQFSEGLTLENMIDKLPPTAKEFTRKFFENITQPFYIISDYITTSSILPDTIVHMVNTLKDALANASIDKATITDLRSQIANMITKTPESSSSSNPYGATDQTSAIMELTGKLNTVLANDATEQASITNLEGTVGNLNRKMSTVQMASDKWVADKIKLDADYNQKRIADDKRLADYMIKVNKQNAVQDKAIQILNKFLPSYIKRSYIKR